MRMRAPLFFDAAHSQHGTCATLPWDCDECVCLCEWVDLHGGGSWLVAGLWLLVLGLMSGGVAGDAAMIGLRCCGRKGNCDGWCKCSGSPRVGEVVGVAGVVSSSGASAATPPAGSPATLHYAKSGKSSRSCSYYQEDTPAPIGDHRYAMNNTCDNGIQHWFKIGSNWNLQGHK